MIDQNLRLPIQLGSELLVAERIVVHSLCVGQCRLRFLGGQLNAPIGGDGDRWPSHRIGALAFGIGFGVAESAFLVERSVVRTHVVQHLLGGRIADKVFGTIGRMRLSGAGHTAEHLDGVGTALAEQRLDGLLVVLVGHVGRTVMDNVVFLMFLPVQR